MGQWTPKTITVFDFEYIPDHGFQGWPDPVCFVARTLEVNGADGFTSIGPVISGGWNEMKRMKSAPWETGPENVSVAFSGHGDLACFDALGWSKPVRFVDLMLELRWLLNGTPADPFRLGLNLFLDRFGIPRPPDSFKDEMRDIILRGDSHHFKAEILRYCQMDVDLTVDLVRQAAPYLDWRRAIGVRGSFAQVMANAELRGLPVDVPLVDDLNRYWPEIQGAAKRRVNETLGYPVFNEIGTFKVDVMTAYLSSQGLLEGWPRTDKTGTIRLTDQDLKDWSKTRHDFQVLYETQKTLKQGSQGLRLKIAPNGRAGFWANPCGTKTGRNAPRGDKPFLFSGARWIRGLMKPAEGRAISVMDWKSQEIQVAAGLSGDSNLLACYQAPDPYVHFAKMAGAVPDDATKESHPVERKVFKETLLGLAYGMGARSLAFRLSTNQGEADRLIRLHKAVFAQYWEWIESIRIQARIDGMIRNPMGWMMSVDGWTSSTTLGNWPVQSCGAAMLQVAAVEVAREGVPILATVHDSLIIETKADEIEQATARTIEIMERASQIVTGQPVPCRVDPKIVRWPDRYMDPDGADMFHFIMDVLERSKQAEKRNFQTSIDFDMIGTNNA